MADYTLEILVTIILLEILVSLFLYIESMIHKLIKRKSKQMKDTIKYLIDEY